jgi:predicted RNA-binding Zn-ribbon protein involved in translation (DUF1610 family)
VSSYSGESGHRARADVIIDAIQRVLKRNGINADATEYRSRNTLSWDNLQDRRRVREMFDGFAEDEAILPGFGPEGLGGNARDDCGEKHPFVCDSCGQRVDFGRTCSQSVCARCGVAWCRDLAIKKSAKIRRVRKEKHHHTPPSEHQKIHHQVISPPLEWYADLARAGVSIEEARDLTKEVVKDILDEMRAQGLLVRHSYRFAKDDGSILSETDSRGRYKEILNSDRNFYGDVRDELAWKPHYHAVVVADWLEVKGDGDSPGLSDRVEKQTGWVIHRIENDDGVSIPTDGAMARVVSYTLSHADIDVNPDGPNRSAVWEVGSFYGQLGDDGGPIKSTPKFSANPADLEWADAVVRRVAAQTLGIRSGTTECGAQLPAVDDPDEMARRIIEELYPKDDRKRRTISPDVILHHVSEGNIQVDVSTTSGGGGDVTVRDAFGEPVGDGGWGSNIPDVPSSGTYGGGGDQATATTPIVTDSDPADLRSTDDCGCGEDHDDQDDDRECDGQLIPLSEARQRDFLEDDDWCRTAPHVDEARAADEEFPDDLDPWRTSSPGKAIGAG